MRLQATSMLDATLLLGSGLTAVLTLGLGRLRREQKSHEVVAVRAEG